MKSLKGRTIDTGGSACPETVAVASVWLGICGKNIRLGIKNEIYSERAMVSRASRAACRFSSFSQPFDKLLSPCVPRNMTRLDYCFTEVQRSQKTMV
jgi:hypothetical protein